MMTSREGKGDDPEELARLEISSCTVSTPTWKVWVATTVSVGVPLFALFLMIIGLITVIQWILYERGKNNVGALSVATVARGRGIASPVPVGRDYIFGTYSSRVPQFGFDGNLSWQLQSNWQWARCWPLLAQRLSL